MAVRPRDPRSGEREPVPFGIAGLTPAAALWALVERSLLTLAEVRMLEQAAAGARPVLSLLGITQRQASMALDRWRGSETSTVPWQRLKPLYPALLVVVVAFTVLRNLSVGAWLAP